MARTKSASKQSVVTELLEEPKRKKKRNGAKTGKQKAHEARDAAIERVLSQVEAPKPSEAPASTRKPAARTETGTTDAIPALRMARVVTAAGRAAEIQFRGANKPIVAAVAPEVETAVVARAAEQRELVLVEVLEGTPPVIVGVVQTREVRDAVLKGATVTIEAEREILLKTGRGALRIREDGDIELVGSRIMAMSRGLFRIVGRMLRLN